MKPRECLGAFAVLAVAPIAAKIGGALADRMAALNWPIFCYRHGWVYDPCERCQVWESPHYASDQARADRAEASTIAKLERAQNGG